MKRENLTYKNSEAISKSVIGILGEEGRDKAKELFEAITAVNFIKLRTATNPKI